MIDKIKAIFKINWIKTLYFNFKMLPFSDACKLPVIIWGKCRLDLKGGKLIFETPIRRGLVKIGLRYEKFHFRQGSQFILNGTFTIRGEIWFGTSVSVSVQKEAMLTMGNISSLGSLSLLICEQNIVFSDYTRIGSHSRIVDTNNHFIKDLQTSKIHPLCKDIILGSHNYFGSNVTILAGTKTPNNTTIGLGSICNKDYTIVIPENSIIAGIPAKLVKSNVVRIFDFQKEREILKYFQQTGAEFYIDNDNQI